MVAIFCMNPVSSIHLYVAYRHQAREAEPKDYDIKDYQPQKRNLHNSTYHRIGNVTDGVSQ